MWRAGETTAQQIVVLAEEARVHKLMIRSGGSVKGGAYYRGGNSLPICQVDSHAVDLKTAGRVVIPLESVSRFTNQRITSRGTERLKKRWRRARCF